MDKKQKNKQQPEIAAEDKHSSPVKAHPKEKLILDGGKFCLDIAKLIFGGVILAGIMKQGMDIVLLFCVGLTVVMIFVFLGFYMINKLK